MELDHAGGVGPVAHHADLLPAPRSPWQEVAVPHDPLVPLEELEGAVQEVAVPHPLVLLEELLEGAVPVLLVDEEDAVALSPRFFCPGGNIVGGIAGGIMLQAGGRRRNHRRRNLLDEV